MCIRDRRLCDFLSVCHGNLGPILHLFRDVGGFCARDAYSVLMSGAFPLDHMANIGVGLSEQVAISYSAMKLLSKCFKLCHHGMVSKRHQTDRQMDGPTTYCGITVQAGTGMGSLLTVVSVCMFHFLLVF